MNFNSKANLTLQHLRTVLSTITSSCSPVTIELMVHPGYPNTVSDGGCGAGPDNFSQDKSRRWELEFLISDELKHYLSEENLWMRSWEEEKN